MASLTCELSGLRGFNSPNLCSGTDARFPLLNERCAFSCEWPFRLIRLSPNAAPMGRRLIADFIRICLFCDSAKRASCNTPIAVMLTLSDSVEPHHRADNALSRAASNSQRRLMPALSESRKSHKGFGILRPDGIRSHAEGGKLNQAKERRATL